MDLLSSPLPSSLGVCFYQTGDGRRGTLHLISRSRSPDNLHALRSGTCLNPAASHSAAESERISARGTRKTKPNRRFSAPQTTCVGTFSAPLKPSGRVCRGCGRARRDRPARPRRAPLPLPATALVATTLPRVSRAGRGLLGAWWVEAL